MTELETHVIEQMQRIAVSLTGPDWKSRGTSDREYNLARTVLELSERLDREHAANRRTVTLEQIEAAAQALCRIEGSGPYYPEHARQAYRQWARAAFRAAGLNVEVSE
jgi:hypothetical protein